MALEFERSLAIQGNGFTAMSGIAALSGTTEADMFLIKNPTASGKRVFITHLTLSVDSGSVRSLWKVYLNPSITSDGTPLAERNININSPNTTVATTFKTPTISARGTLFEEVVMPSNSSSKGLSRFYLIGEGDSLLVTVTNSVSNAKTGVGCFWMELELGN